MLGLIALACNLPGSIPGPVQPTQKPAQSLTPEAAPSTPIPTEVPPTITVEPSATALFLSGGENYELPDDACFDLDAGAEVNCQSPEADIQFIAEETESTASWEVRPINPTLIRTLGIDFQSEDPPTKNQCEERELKTEPLVLLPMAETIWNCYRTGESHLGWIRTHSWVPGVLLFSWGTFSGG